jgi:tungstate transport system permease protein
MVMRVIGLAVHMGQARSRPDLAALGCTLRPDRTIGFLEPIWQDHAAVHNWTVATVSDSFGLALALIAGLDPHFVGIVALSLRVSLASTLCAAAVGLPIGAAVAIADFRGRAVVVATLNALMGLPPVVAGLLVYLLLSRAGPLGALGLLFTPGAMVIAQTVLIAPIIAALTRQVVEDAWVEHHDALRSLHAGTLQSARTLIWDTRYALATVLLAGFGRAAAEVGAVIIVGGNIDGVTRVMTTAIALETSKGDLPLALALGIVLMALVLVLNFGAYATREWARARFG